MTETQLLRWWRRQPVWHRCFPECQRMEHNTCRRWAGVCSCWCPCHRLVPVGDGHHDSAPADDKDQADDNRSVPDSPHD